MLYWQCGEEVESRCTFDKWPGAQIENDIQLSVQIEAKVAVSYHQSLHFQVEHSYQPVLFVKDSSMLDIVTTLTNGNPFEMQHKEKFASNLEMILSLGSLTIGNE